MIGLPRSSFYYPSHARNPSLSDTKLVEKIRQIQERFPRYGYRRLVAVFRKQGVCINAKKMRRILSQYRLSPKPFSRRCVKTTDNFGLDRRESLRVRI